MTTINGAKLADGLNPGVRDLLEERYRQNTGQLLLSAKVPPGEEIAAWLRSTTGQTVHCFIDQWNLTRQ